MRESPRNARRRCKSVRRKPTPRAVFLLSRFARSKPDADPASPEQLEMDRKREEKVRVCELARLLASKALLRDTEV